MNLFQQILSVSKEFREHFEKEKEQEERLKAVEEMLSGGGGGGSAGVSAYQPYKKQSMVLKYNPSNDIKTSIIRYVGDNLIQYSESDKIYRIDPTYFEDGDIIKTTVTIATHDNYEVCIPNFNIQTGNGEVNTQAVTEHNISGMRHETYCALAQLSKYEYQGMEFTENDMVFRIQDYSNPSSISSELIRNFSIVIDVEIHKVK